ncbi:twin-arginine translocase subunit TatC [Microbacterium sp. BWR-S6Y]|uniref:twin-arginine translocase subunit TatC n=1 Tax=Microbacterium sp. BWR-S6Y TaxID=3232073 RepID=UPI003529B791
MPLLSHLSELRRRLVITASAILVGGVIGFFLSDAVIAAVADPLAHVQGPSVTSLNFTRLGEAFDLRFKIALTLGIVLAAPVWIWQVWAFLVPALTSRERRIGIGFVCAAVPLFLIGVGFGWTIVPHVVNLLAGFAPAASTTILTAGQYFDFLLKLILGVGLSFVSPLALIALNAAGVLSARAIIRGWRIALVVIVVFSAVVTPASDIMSMLFVALPLCVLYAGAAVWTYAHDRRIAGRATSLP